MLSEDLSLWRILLGFKGVCGMNKTRIHFTHERRWHYFGVYMCRTIETNRFKDIKLIKKEEGWRCDGGICIIIMTKICPSLRTRGNQTTVARWFKNGLVRVPQ